MASCGGEQAASPERALEHYRVAARLLPAYIVGNVHLAELEIQTDQALKAEQRLRKVVDSTDPEPAGLLAELLLQERRISFASYAKRAAAAYEELLTRYPKAFLDHASEFFLSPVGGDKPRALRLAQENLLHRQNARAYLIAIEAARAANPSLVCELVAQAQTQAAYNVNLAQLTASVASACSPTP